MVEIATRPQRPRASVIVPVSNGARTLAGCLSALRASTLDREQWELIVVDDASCDGSARIAATFADAVVCLPGPQRGPAYARNRGAEASRGEILIFVDPVVAVAPEALERLLGAFDASAELSAASGAWAPDPGGSLASRYQALWRLFEQRPGQPPRFWAGLGAVRAGVFAEVGPFDEWLYPSSSVEDAELGHRMRLAGHQAVRVPDVYGTCLDTATLRTVLWDEVHARVMPATRLALHVGGRSADPRVGHTFLSGAFAAVAVLALILAPLRAGAGAMWIAGIAVVGFIAWDRDLLRYAARTRGPLFTLAALPLHLGAAASRAVGACIGWCAHHLVGPPRVPIEIYAKSAEADTAAMWPPPPVQPTASVWARPPLRAPRRSRRVAA